MPSTESPPTDSKAQKSSPRKAPDRKTGPSDSLRPRKFSAAFFFPINSAVTLETCLSPWSRKTPLVRLLLIDNSNTRTKFALASGEHLDPGIIRIPTAALDRTAIEELRERLEFDASVLCSVVPAKSRVLRAALAGKPLHVVGCHSTLPIGINYPAPEQIGADRLANAVAAYQQWGAPAVVIDFGTAVTFDVVGLDEGQPSYLGGVITPGLASMTENLHRRTALLPQIDLAEPKSSIGKSTIEAMQVGAVYGYRGMIREILTAIRRELDHEPTVIATGGDAALIAAGLTEVSEVVPGLTLEGIRLIGACNLS